MSPRAGPEEPPDDAPLFEGKVLTSAEIEKRLKAWREGAHLSDYDAAWNAAIERAAEECMATARGMSAIGPLGYAGAAEAARNVRYLKRKP